MNKVYQEIASRLDAMARCASSGKDEWATKHKERIEWICANQLPHGSGIDMGVKLDWEKSRRDRLVFLIPYHRMDQNGFYAGWYDYTATVTPSLAFEFELKVRTRGLKSSDAPFTREYLSELMHHHLNQEAQKE